MKRAPKNARKTSAPRLRPAMAGALLALLASPCLAAADSGLEAPAPVAAVPAASISTHPAPASTPAPTVPVAATPIAPRAAPVPTGPILQFGLDDARIGDRVEYQVGLPPAGGVENRAAYKISYEVRGVRAQEVTLVRATRTLEGRELAREIFTVKRYPTLAAAPAQRDPDRGVQASARPAVTVEMFVLADRKIDCRCVQDIVRENGLVKKLAWGLSTAIPITGLVYEKVNGIYSLELLDFARGVDAGTAAVTVEPTQTPEPPPVAEAPTRPDSPVENVPPTLPPIDTTPRVHIPALTEKNLPLEGEPDATAATEAAP